LLVIDLLIAGWLADWFACLLACLLLLNQKCNYDLKAFLEAHPKKRVFRLKLKAQSQATHTSNHSQRKRKTFGHGNGEVKQERQKAHKSLRQSQCHGIP